MTDLEMVKLCAEAMGFPHWMQNVPFTDKPIFCAAPYDLPGRIHPYNPLHDDAQAMALVKRFDLFVDRMASKENGWMVKCDIGTGNAVICADLNRAIVECVAQMQEKGK